MSDSKSKNRVTAGLRNESLGSAVIAISSGSTELAKDPGHFSTREVILGNRNFFEKEIKDDLNHGPPSLEFGPDPSSLINSADYKGPLSYDANNTSQQASSLGSSFIMIWLSCLHQLRNEVDKQIFSAYLEPLSPIAYSLEKNEFKLSAPSKFLINQVERHFSPRIAHLASEAVANFFPAKEITSPLKVVIVVEESPPPLPPSNSTPGIFANRGHPSVRSSSPPSNMAPHRYVVVKKTVPVDRPSREVVDANISSNQSPYNSRADNKGPASSRFESSGREPNQANRVSSDAKSNSGYSTQAPIRDHSTQLPIDKIRNADSNSDGPKRSDSEPELFESGLSRRYLFTNFVVGNSNQFCHAAAMRVAENPGNSYNPLFIYGGVGLGKTHLLHSIGNSVLDKNPNAQILYMSSEAFTNELIQSLRYAKMEEFKRRLRNINVLLIDDIQFIAGKERTQEEFFHTFNALYAAKRQIVITSDRLPSDIPGIEERLQTRFSWGLTADLQAPDFETRVAILKKKGFLDGIDLPEDVAHFIAESVSSNVRELEGALTRLHAVCSIQNIPLTVKSAQSALKAILQPKIVQLSVDDIKKAVASHFGLKVTEMVSKRRTKNLSFPRHIAMYLCRKHTTASYPEIGNNFGGRDHSSVIHAASVVSSKIQSDEEVRSLITDLECQLFNN